MSYASDALIDALERENAKLRRSLEMVQLRNDRLREENARLQARLRVVLRGERVKDRPCD